jgi:hypothetical protein
MKKHGKLGEPDRTEAAGAAAVGMGPLTPDRKPQTVAQSEIGAGPLLLANTNQLETAEAAT